MQDLVGMAPAADEGGEGEGDDDDEEHKAQGSDGGPGGEGHGRGRMGDQREEGGAHVQPQGGASTGHQQGPQQLGGSYMKNVAGVEGPTSSGTALGGRGDVQSVTMEKPLMQSQAMPRPQKQLPDLSQAVSCLARRAVRVQYSTTWCCKRGLWDIHSHRSQHLGTSSKGFGYANQV